MNLLGTLVQTGVLQSNSLPTEIPESNFLDDDLSILAEPVEEREDPQPVFTVNWGTNESVDMFETSDDSETGAGWYVDGCERRAGGFAAFEESDIGLYAANDGSNLSPAASQEPSQARGSDMIGELKNYRKRRGGVIVKNTPMSNTM